jgi:hypothetical protein
MKVFGLKRGGDPLLSRLVRGAVNRPSLERRVGLMAQDFFQTFAGENLFLTRSTRLQGVPTLPSRLLLRLEAALEASGQTQRESLHWRQWAHQMEIPNISFSRESAGSKSAFRRQEGVLVGKDGHLWLGLCPSHKWNFGAVSPMLRMLVISLKLRPLDPLDQESLASLLGLLIHHHN